jgi:hypothetical protein
MKKLVFATIVAGTTVCSSIGIMFLGCGTAPIGDSTGSAGVPGGTAGIYSINLDGSVFGQGGRTGQEPTADANCGSSTSLASQLPADVLLVLDRSSSMVYSIAEECYCDKTTQRSAPAGNGSLCSNTSNCTTRWQSVTSGVTTTLTSTPSIRWGLKFFSSPNSSGRNVACNVNKGADVAIGDNSAASIQTQISAAQPSNNTPTAAAITAATAYLKTVTDPDKKVILLATDGEPNCGAGGGDSDVPGTKAAITAAKDAGYPVYVIGIGPSVGNLDSFAQAGGTDKSYPATSPQALADALSAISQVVANCSFALTTAPKGTNNIAVYLDGAIAPSTDWTYTASSQTVALTGSSCDAIKNGTAKTVQVYFGCGEVPPPIIK